MIKGVAIAASDHSENIRKLLLQDCDLVEFDPLQILAQEMATPILLRSGMPIDCLDYTSGEMLFKLEHLENSTQLDTIKSPKDLVKACFSVLAKLPYATIVALSDSIDLGKLRLLSTMRPDTLPEFRKRGYLTIESNRTHEVVICTPDDSFLIVGNNPIESVFEIIEREKLLPRKVKLYNFISAYSKDYDLCKMVSTALRQVDSKLDKADRKLRNLWIVSETNNNIIEEDINSYRNNYDFCLIADGSNEQIKAAALSLLYYEGTSAYVRASDF